MAKMLYLAGLLGAAATLRSSSLMQNPKSPFVDSAKKNPYAIVWDNLGRMLGPQEMLKLGGVAKRFNPDYNFRDDPNGVKWGPDEQGNVLTKLGFLNSQEAGMFPFQALIMTLLRPEDFAQDPRSYHQNVLGKFDEDGNPVNWHNRVPTRVVSLEGLLNVGITELQRYLSSFYNQYKELKSVVSEPEPAGDGADGAPTEEERKEANSLVAKIEKNPYFQGIPELIKQVGLAVTLADPRKQIELSFRRNWTPEHFDVSQTADGFRMARAEGTLDGEPDSDEVARDPYIVTFPEDSKIVVDVPAEQSLTVDFATIRKISIDVNEGGEFVEIRAKGEFDQDIDVSYDLKWNSFESNRSLWLQNTPFIKLLVSLRRIHFLQRIPLPQ